MGQSFVADGHAHQIEVIEFRQAGEMWHAIVGYFCVFEREAAEFFHTFEVDQPFIGYAGRTNLQGT